MQNVIKTEAVVGTTYEIDPTSTDILVLPLSQPLTTIAIKNAAPGTTLTLVLKQTIGGRRIQWATNIQFSFFREPKLAYDAGYADRIDLMTLDGSNWIATYAAGWFHA